MSGTVFVLTPDLNGTVGGVKVHYQVVDALNADGRTGVRGAWQARVFGAPGSRTRRRRLGERRSQVSRRRRVVVPEEWVQHIPTLPVDVDKVVFNQNVYTTFLWGAAVGASIQRLVLAVPTSVGSSSSLPTTSTTCQYAFPTVRAPWCSTDRPDDVLRGRPQVLVRSPTCLGSDRRRRRRCSRSSGHVASSTAGRSMPIEGRIRGRRPPDILRRTSVFLSFCRREGQPTPTGRGVRVWLRRRGLPRLRRPGHRARTRCWVSDGEVVGVRAHSRGRPDVVGQRVRAVGSARDVGATRHIRSKYALRDVPRDRFTGRSTGLGETGDQRIVGQPVDGLLDRWATLSDGSSVACARPRRSLLSGRPVSGREARNGSEAGNLPLAARGRRPRRSSGSFEWQIDEAKRVGDRVSSGSFGEQVGESRDPSVLLRMIIPGRSIHCFRFSRRRSLPQYRVYACSDVDEAVRAFRRDGFVVLSDGLLPTMLRS